MNLIVAQLEEITNMRDEILQAVEKVLDLYLTGQEPSNIDEQGSGMYWDLSKILVDHYQAEIGEKMEAKDMVYYAIYDLTEVLLQAFFELFRKQLINIDSDEIQ